MNEKGKPLVERRNLTMYPRHWRIVELYAEYRGFSLSLAMRQIIEEWQQLRRLVAEREYPDQSELAQRGPVAVVGGSTVAAERAEK